MLSKFSIICMSEFYNMEKNALKYRVEVLCRSHCEHRRKLTAVGEKTPLGRGVTYPKYEKWFGTGWRRRGAQGAGKNKMCPCFWVQRSRKSGTSQALEWSEVRLEGKKQTSHEGLEGDQQCGLHLEAQARHSHGPLPQPKGTSGSTRSWPVGATSWTF